MGAPLEVAFDMTFPDRNRGGSAVYTRSLLAALREREDVAVSEVSAPAGASLSGTLRWLAAGARGALWRSPAALLHCPAFVCPWRLPLPYVMTIPDTLARRFPQDHPLEWRFYERRLLPRLARGAARVITGSEFSRDELIRDYGLAPSQVSVTRFGVDRRFFLAGQVAPRDVRSKPVLLFPGAPLGRKNLPVVLDCLASAPPRSAISRAVLEITGAAAEEHPEHAAAAARLGLGSRVRWLGQVPAELLPERLAAADAVVYPSLYEGFGFPPLEAMAAGTPVVCSNASCLPETTGGGALLVDPADVRGLGEALEAVLTRPELRARLLEAGARVAARHTWERCAEETLGVYREALERERWTA